MLIREIVTLYHVSEDNEACLHRKQQINGISSSAGRRIVVIVTG